MLNKARMYVLYLVVKFNERLYENYICLDVLEPFIAEVIPRESENNACELICIDDFIADIFEEDELKMVG